MTRQKHSPRSRAVSLIDLFAGPGGLSEGFAQFAAQKGHVFHGRLSVERDPIAHQTLELRAFFRQFEDAVPDEYFRFVRGEMTREALFGAYPEQAASARAEAWCHELGETGRSRLFARIDDLELGNGPRVLIGGPPCQAYSLVGRSRNKGNASYRPEGDVRHTLYQEYLQVIAKVQPDVFVMENVKGLLSARYQGEAMFERIYTDLTDPARALGKARGASSRYQIIPIGISNSDQGSLALGSPSPSDYTVRCELHGVPQCRHRLILLGVRGDHVPEPSALALLPAASVSVKEAIGDLPKVRSGVSAESDAGSEWAGAVRAGRSAAWYHELRKGDGAVAGRVDDAIKALRDTAGRGAECVLKGRRSAPAWAEDPRMEIVLNHSTRRHIREDLWRYLFCASFAQEHRRSPTLGDFPPSLLPDHKNARAAAEGGPFADRFRVQVADRPSTTITSHISKDGHYYIHYDPSQCRSLTVREAARLQTFPDNYFFCGGRTAQYHQVGNAVPPLLARQIAEVVADILG